MNGSPAFYPLAVRLGGARVLLAGGGRVALRKLRTLLAAGAVCTVVAPELDERLAAAGLDFQWIRRAFEPGDLAGAQLALACTNDPAANGAVEAACRAGGVPVCRCDGAASSDFVFPAALRRGPLCVAVSTDGTDPALARDVRDRIGALLPEDLGRAAELSGALRGAGRTPARESAVAAVFFGGGGEPLMRAACRTMGQLYPERSVHCGVLRAWEPFPPLGRLLEELAAAGCRDVLVQPYLLCGGALYRSAAAELKARAGLFEQTALGRPLLASRGDCRALARILAAVPRGADPRAGRLWVRHRSADPLYAALDEELAARDPLCRAAPCGGAEPFAEYFAQRGVRRVELRSLFVLGGVHFARDAAGEEADSARGVLESRGIAVDPDASPLLALPGVRRLFAARCVEAEAAR